MSTFPDLKNWKLESDIDNIIWLTFDRPGEKANVLSTAVIKELDTAIAAIETENPAGLVLRSGKHESFIFGADVNEFDNATDPAEAADGIRSVHTLFNRIEALSFPTVVCIEGFCLGGGLELALAFDWRIAKNIDKTRIGFPEMNLGIFPGFGGAARTIRKLGGKNALPLMLAARFLRAPAAKKLGLVDQLVSPQTSIDWAARKAIARKLKSKAPGRSVSILNSGPARRWLAKFVRKETAKKANPKHYPAPYKLIDLFEQHADDFPAMLEAEAVGVGELIVGDTSRNLRRVFKLMERLKAEGKKSDNKVRRVHVIGAGVMGGDIAAWCVLRGLEVTLQDREMKYIEPAMKRAGKLFSKKIRSKAARAAAKARLIADVDGNGIARADVIIEAIFENLEAKQELFKIVEKQAPKHAILATNTSAIPLADIASALRSPKRLIGLHFFNPVAKMPLLEVVYDNKTDKQLINRACAFASQISRFPLLVKSSPGFLVNRVLAPYMSKAMTLYQSGIPKEAIDKAATDFGMPMGPVELADTVGLDVGLGVVSTLGGDNTENQVAFLKKYIDAGKLGKKSSEGFYVWEKGRAKKDSEAIRGHNLKKLADELMQPYFDECRACLADGIVADADIIDAGMIFGTGFAPFLGGPLHYLESQEKQSSTKQEASS
ncbi:MAG: 3-hydroxyacyl-CoA dehydrogenase NAD-binding domain-containing protein [Xanthomonadales bacterium]|nr:3-hydroxyacyl-CoA dehydrogenase NAD-binding domain-containing protein [Xanthomonadales bacterium]